MFLFFQYHWRGEEGAGAWGKKTLITKKTIKEFMGLWFSLSPSTWKERQNPDTFKTWELSITSVTINVQKSNTRLVTNYYDTYSDFKLKKKKKNYGLGRVLILF